MTEAKKAESSAAPKAPEPPKKKPPTFEQILSQVDPASLQDELEAIVAAYEAIGLLPSPKDPTKAVNVAALKDKIRTTIGSAEGGVRKAIHSLEALQPLLKSLGDAIKELDERDEKKVTK